MGHKFQQWHPRSDERPQALADVARIIHQNRKFEPQTSLTYGEHGLGQVIDAIESAIDEGKRIALYADYDVDGTMSCVSWMWFLKAIGYTNFLHYIPCRFKEGYGVNLSAVKYLIDEQKADVIITMDTGITANEEAAYCKSRGVTFICTDHHKIQPEKMPDTIILNPKMHPDPMYQELCGCGITFVLLRKLAERYKSLPASIWTDILALTGMATICDVVPLNGVNHRLAKLGVEALMRSERPVLKRLISASRVDGGVSESDVGFRLGPRINAVGRLEHADLVIKAFADEDPGPLISAMGRLNDERKIIQGKIVIEAREQARTMIAAAGESAAPILFLGGDWHPGVVGIAASKMAEEFWRPTWLFQIKDGICKGSARSVPGFDVTEAMEAAKDLFTKFGGHRAAGGFSFVEDNLPAIRARLVAYADGIRTAHPEMWRSRLDYDCALAGEHLSLDLVKSLESMKPFGHGFEEPRFLLDAVVSRVGILKDKKTGLDKHTQLVVGGRSGLPVKAMFFNEVLRDVQPGQQVRLVVTAQRNSFMGKESLQLMGVDWGG